MTVVPRLVIAAPSAGSGKTTVTTGILAALNTRGLRVSGHTIGPDHVGPAYHTLAAGRRGHNLDPRLLGPKRIAPLFAAAAQAADVAIVEGVAGLYDDAGTQATTAQVAALLQAPVVLVVNAAGQGRSAAATVQGMRNFDPSLWLAGVIFTGVSSSSHARSLREALMEIGVTVLGVLDRDGLAPLPSHRSGIVPAGHRDRTVTAALASYAASVRRGCDLDQLLAIARSAPAISSPMWSASDAVAVEGAEAPERWGSERPTVAMLGAGDLAYGYAETRALLEAAGAHIELVDPLRDSALPPATSGLVIGGGLPTHYVEELAKNTELCAAVRQLAAADAPILAEGGGVWWLANGFDSHEMCGVIGGRAHLGDQAFGGYRDAIAVSDHVAANAGTRVVGHVLRRWEMDPRAGGSAAWRWSGRPAEGFVRSNLYASFLELGWPAMPQRMRLFTERAAAANSRMAPSS